MELPSFDLLAMGVTWIVIKKTGNNGLNLRVNVNNDLHKIYISELTSANFIEAGDESYQGVNVNNFGYFGLGRTWNASLRYTF